jgi:flagellar motility protein MotE (MotC chaperone)
MIRYLRDFRLVPIVLFATISLFALKTAGLILQGHYALEDFRNADDMADISGSIAGAGLPARGAAASKNEKNDKPAATLSWAQQMFNFPDTTGAVGEKIAEKKETPPPQGNRAPSKPEEPKGGAGWTPVPIDGSRPKSAAEIAILERLQERRSELDARAKELEMRESLLQAAEKRLEARVNELKDLEARVSDMVQQRDDGETTRFKNVVTMYENMKAKDAAKIFDRLDLKILVEVATKINPRRMSDILAQMAPETAERLTVELAARSAAKDKSAELPKIEGKPNPN